MVVEVEEEATMMRSARTGKQEYMYTHLFQNRNYRADGVDGPQEMERN